MRILKKKEKRICYANLARWKSSFYAHNLASNNNNYNKNNRVKWMELYSTFNNAATNVR